MPKHTNTTKNKQLDNNMIQKIYQYLEKKKTEKFINKTLKLEEEKKQLKQQIIYYLLNTEGFEPLNDDDTPMTQTQLEKYKLEELTKLLQQLIQTMEQEWQ